MNIKEYTKIIKKEFSFLFKKYGFKIVHSEEFRSGYGWFHIGLESKACRILFAREQGGGNIFIGNLDAPFNDDNDERWVHLLNLLSYILNKKWAWTFLDKLSPNERIVAWLSFNSRELEPICGQILEMFSSEEAIATWRPSYDQYIDRVYKEGHNA